MQTKTQYQVGWDNGHASGTFERVFTSKRAAKQYGAAWKRELVAVEPTAAERREAREAYQYEIYRKRF